MGDDFLLIRHAESEWNARALWQGQADPPLSERGRRQASALAAELVAEGIELLFTSDLRRATQTAAIVGDAIGCSPQPDRRLRELDVGRWAGLSRDEIERLDPDLLARFEAEDADARPGGGETRREIRERTRRAVADLAARHAGRRVAVVTHLGVIRAVTRGRELENAGWCRVARAELLESESVAGGAPAS